jgi:hypothetical protein
MGRRPKICDILWDFTEEFCKGNIPKVSNYEHIFKNKRKQKILMEDLISAKIAYLIAHPELDLAEDSETLSKLFIMLKSLRKRR